MPSQPPHELHCNVAACLSSNRFQEHYKKACSNPLYTTESTQLVDDYYIGEAPSMLLLELHKTRRLYLVVSSCFNPYLLLLHTIARLLRLFTLESSNKLHPKTQHRHWIFSRHLLPSPTSGIPKHTHIRWLERQSLRPMATPIRNHKVWLNAAVERLVCGNEVAAGLRPMEVMLGREGSVKEWVGREVGRFVGEV